MSIYSLVARFRNLLLKLSAHPLDVDLIVPDYIVEFSGFLDHAPHLLLHFI